MAPLGTGRFIITHSKFKNVAYLADANSSSDLHGDWRQNRPGERWNVVLLSNGNYTIKNSGHSSYATCEFIARPDVGNNIVGGDHEQQWKIVEDHANSYVICPTKNGHVYWHLADGESGTPITLEYYAPTSKIQWEFRKVEDANWSGVVGGGEPIPEPIASGSRYTIRVAGTNRYLGVPFWRHTVHTSRYRISDSWLITRSGDNWQIQLWRSDKYLSFPKHSARRVSDDPAELSLTPSGRPNEFKITDVDSGGSWDGLMLEWYK